MKPIQLLLREALTSPILEPGDVPVLKDIALKMSIDAVNVVLDVNTAIRGQVDLEASITYLCNHYRGLKARLELERDRVWHAAGLRHGKQSAERNLDEEYQELLTRYTEHSLFCTLLDDLREITFRRNDKLEQLSVNLRREALADAQGRS